MAAHGNAHRRTLPDVYEFDAGPRADRSVVEAILTLPWSRRQMEGHVNRRETLKRAAGAGKLRPAATSLAPCSLTRPRRAQQECRQTGQLIKVPTDFQERVQRLP